ncbi:hypothetical protein GCM10023320_64840 [Pseudonocardia adelaidensis]|uniref:Uncharacterized protein n=1 Tax=Pseudonocardia adelaidensis TaxID=648754 RepID=A0ABP9NVX0_9PSEU
MSTPPSSSAPVGDRRGDRLGVPHVHLGAHDPAVERFDPGHGLGQVRRGRERVGDRVDLAADVDRDHVRALAREPQRVAAPLPPRRPGDQCDLALEPSAHVPPPFLHDGGRLYGRNACCGRGGHVPPAVNTGPAALEDHYRPAS